MQSLAKAARQLGRRAFHSSSITKSADYEHRLNMVSAGTCSQGCGEAVAAGRGAGVRRRAGRGGAARPPARTDFLHTRCPCAAVRAVEHEEPQAQGNPWVQQQPNSNLVALEAPAGHLPHAPHPPLPPPLAPAPCSPPPLQMGLGVASVVLGGVGIPVAAVQLQFWKAKG